MADSVKSKIILYSVETMMWSSSSYEEDVFYLREQ